MSEQNVNVTDREGEEDSKVKILSADERNEIEKTAVKQEITNEQLNSPTTTITRDDASPTDNTPQLTSNNQQQSSSANYSQFSHPVYKKISAANGRINRMSKDELIDALKYLGLNPK